MFKGLLTGTLLSAACFAAPTPDVADAVMNHSSETIKTLLTQKADVNAAQSDGTTALMWAVRHDDIATVDQLIRAARM